ncbi:helix-hairpin-helix domain-containing protein [Dankookia sp. P2]|uniref:helix-hairpin-helix domain-containing protein n=1 Tax=Dankookia sp. P2 TaxID=3423955 RepID=UPI003D67AC4F
MKPGRLLDASGNPIALGKELGRGGEGAVFDVVGQPDAVAKVYLKPPSAQHAAKLSAMARMATPSLLKIAAWPTGTLQDPSGKVAGFTMPKVGGHEPVFKLYGPKLRLQEFPTADWRFLIHAAANAARSFSTVHAAGLVIGDVNHGNLVVGQDATVRMIDCDSFQVIQGSSTWFCEVGVGTHQPPEMQGRASYAGVVRTPNQDSFGLAVIVFQLLCIARHPFAGRYKGAGEPPSIEDAIQASRYAYSRDRPRTAMEPPPGSLPIGALTPTIQDLFEKAFAPETVRGGRPGADQWVAALGELSSDLRVCGTNGGHYYRKGLSACPWCAIENASGITLFPVVFKPGATVGVTGMAALWQEVSKVPDPPSVGRCPPPARGGPGPVFSSAGACRGWRQPEIRSVGLCGGKPSWHPRHRAARPVRSDGACHRRDCLHHPSQRPHQPPEPLPAKAGRREAGLGGAPAGLGRTTTWTGDCRDPSRSEPHQGSARPSSRRTRQAPAEAAGAAAGQAASRTTWTASP